MALVDKPAVTPGGLIVDGAIVQPPAQGYDPAEVLCRRAEPPHCEGPFSAAELALANTLLEPMAQALETQDRIQSLTQALDTVRQGVFILDSRGRLQHANAVGERMLSQGEWVRSQGGRFVAGRACLSRRPIVSPLGEYGAAAVAELFRAM